MMVVTPSQEIGADHDGHVSVPWIAAPEDDADGDGQ